MRQVKLEDTVDFGTLVGEVEAGGEGVTLLRGGKPVAQVIPFPVPADEARRLAAVARAVAIMDAGYDLGGYKIDRDELYSDALGL